LSVARLADAFRVDGQVALVTGGAGTIGRSLCAALAEAGATVICAARHLDRCEEVVESIRRDGWIALALPLDLANPDSIDDLYQSARERAGSVDILVNNAVSQVPGHVERYSVEAWEAAMAVDATGFFKMTQVCLNGMLEKGRGNIITVASILGTVAAEARLYPARGIEGFRPSYFFTKAGVVGFTRFIATAYADRNIRANCISPGGVETDPPRADAGAFIDRVPMKRLAQPDDLKGAVAYLASDASAYVTGHNLIVDGGYTAW
jgi:NAD(P)-dependent dehydrogenase (short-subunit alcohol dehydrogenase family)